MINLVFFGSFQHYSALILKSLIERANHDSPLHIMGVVTTPHQMTKTPVHLLAEQHHLSVFTPTTLETNESRCPDFQRTDMRSDASTAKSTSIEFPIQKPDYFITAGYGKILPQSWLDYPRLGCLNLHFSLLPKYRGANPAEWAIMCGETVTGITLIQMTSKLDGGDILAQAEIPIDPTDNRETLYQKLYQLGAEMLPEWIINITKRVGTGTYPYKKQSQLSPTPIAWKLTKNDGFLPWTTLQPALRGGSLKGTDFPSPHLQKAYIFAHQKENFINRLPRALAGYPSLWTIVPTKRGDKRMKILSFDPFTVQMEGQQPALFNQIKNQLLKS